MLTNLFEVDHIRSDNYREIDRDTVNGLVESIKKVGLQEPLKLFEIEGSGEVYVVSGHHRLEAIRKIKRIPEFAHQIFQALIIKGTKEEYLGQKTAIASVVANMLRKNLEIVDRAEAFTKLKKSGLSASEIGSIVNKDKRTVEMTLNVGLLDAAVKEFIKETPTLKDSVVYKVAVKYKKDPTLEPIALLKASLEQKRQGAVQNEPKLTKVYRDQFKTRLMNEGGFDQKTVARIIGLL